MARQFLIAALGAASLSAAWPASVAHADEEPPSRSDDATSTDDAPPKPVPTPPHVTFLGYVEGFYQYNFNRPSNGLTNYRAFDNRANSFTLANVAVGAAWEAGPVVGKLVLQVGHTPSTYYASSEPTSPGSSGANASSSELWKYVQEANVGYKAPVGNGLLLQLGLFLSPIGPESMAIHDQWNWSRSTLFYALPYYHAGLRATYELTPEWTASLGVYNGWNDIVDNNEDKSFAATLAYKVADHVNAQVHYMSGNERKSGAPEGPYWRHDLDAYAQVDVTPCLSFLAHGNAGFEPNRFGTSTWYAGALYARVKMTEWLYAAVRGDRFWENVASNSSGTADTMFNWPTGTTWVTSGTATLDARPHDNVSIRLEYRRDQADQALYFRSAVTGDGSAANPFVTNARSQDTLTLGATTWF